MVGNSPNILGSLNGERINSFSEVFRFNGAPTIGFEDDIGDKTTGMLIGIDLGFLFCPPYRMPNKNDPDSVRLFNASALLGLYNCPLFVFRFRDDDEKGDRMYRSAHKYLSAAAELRGLRTQFHFFSDDPVLGMTNFYTCNSLLEELGCTTKLTKGGPRTGLRMVIRLLKSGAKPHLFGFTIDPSIDVAKHYHDSITNAKASEYSPHDIQGEARVLLELKEKGLITVY